MKMRLLFLPAVLLTGMTVTARSQTLNDPGLSVTPFTTGLVTPTQLRFIGPDDFFVTEKDTGQIKRVVNGGAPVTVLDLGVSANGERGLLGIAPAPDFATAADKYVYVYYSANGTGSEVDGGTWVENRVSRFTWDGTTLGSESRLAAFGRAADGLPSGPNHNGGPLVFGTDGMLYGVTGDLNRAGAEQNMSSTTASTGGIFRLDPATGLPAPGNPFATHPDPAVQQWYAYGVRNSYGIAVDPVTGELWDTENGLNDFDEINRVQAGMNSGWTRIMGPDTTGQANTLVSLGAAAQYSDPEFTFSDTIGITAIEFAAGSALGSSYDDKVFVSDINNGQIYMLPLNATRTGFELTGLLSDLVADTVGERNQILFGSGFGGITDMQVGPDGALYVTSYAGSIYRVVPEPSSLLLCGLSLAALARRRRD